MVYVIKDNAGHVKIGVAVNVETRLKNLQTAKAKELEDELIFETDEQKADYRLEQVRHVLFEYKNIRNRNNCMIDPVVPKSTLETIADYRNEVDKKCTEIRRLNAELSKVRQKIREQRTLIAELRRENKSLRKKK